MALHVIWPAPDQAGADSRLAEILNGALEGREIVLHRRAEELNGLRGERLLFALPLGETGTNLEGVRILARLRQSEESRQGRS